MCSAPAIIILSTMAATRILRIRYLNTCPGQKRAVSANIILSKCRVYLLQFSRYFSSPNAPTEVVNPLHANELGIEHNVNSKQWDQTHGLVPSSKALCMAVIGVSKIGLTYQRPRLVVHPARCPGALVIIQQWYGC